MDRVDAPSRKRARPPSTPRGRGETALVTVITAVALALRITLVLTTIDASGDGPTRASAAYEWAQRPHLVGAGVWLPGFLYIAGLASMLAPYPWITSRLVNVLLGTATVPVCYLLATRLFGRPAGLLTASVVAVMPLHAALSASSLTETSFVAELALGTLCLIAALGDEPVRRNASTAAALRWPAFLAACAALGWATLTRYEAWWLAPLYVLYVWRRTRARLPTLMLAAATLTVPIAWTIANAVILGDPLVGFTSARKGGEIAGVTPSGPLPALGILATHTFHELGWLLPIACVVGFAWQAQASIRGAGGPAKDARALWLALVAAFWVGIVIVAMPRGSTFYQRYLLAGLVLLLPLAVVPLRRWLGDDPRRLALVVVCACLSTVVPFALSERPPAWLTYTRPVVVEEIAQWLRTGPYRGRNVLLTDMHWQASYLTLYAPELATRRRIVSNWLTDRDLHTIVTTMRPAILITRPGDEALVARVETLLDVSIHDGEPVHHLGDVVAYDIAAPVARFADAERRPP